MSEEVMESIVCNLSQQTQSYMLEMSMMMKEFNEYRKKGQFCDVGIISKDQCFQAHKLILCARSNYFKILFNSPIGNQNLANMDQFSSSSIEFLLALIYNDVDSGKNVDILEVIKLLDFIEANLLLERVIKAIRLTINIDNCIQWYDIIKQTGVKKLEVIIKSFMQANNKELLSKGCSSPFLTDGIKTFLKDSKNVIVSYYFDGMSDYKFGVIDLVKRTFETNLSGPFNTEEFFHRHILAEELHVMKAEDIHVIKLFVYEDSLYFVSDYSKFEIVQEEYWWRCQVHKYDLCSQKYKHLFTVHEFDFILDEIPDDYADDVKVYRIDVHQFGDSMFFVTMNTLGLCVSKVPKSIKMISDEDYLALDQKLLCKTNTGDKFFISRYSEFQKVITISHGLQSFYKVNGSLDEEKIEIEPWMLNGRLPKHCKNNWSFDVTNSGEILFYIVPDDSFQLYVLKLSSSVKSNYWVSIYNVPVTGDLIQVFTYASETYLLFSEIFDYCVCREKDCQKRHVKNGVSNHLYHFDMKKVILKYTGIKLPPSTNSHSGVSIIPNYFLF